MRKRLEDYLTIKQVSVQYCIDTASNKLMPIADCKTDGKHKPISRIQTIYGWLDRGLLTKHSLLGKIVVLKSDLDKFVIPKSGNPLLQNLPKDIMPETVHVLMRHSTYKKNVLAKPVKTKS